MSLPPTRVFADAAALVSALADAVCEEAASGIGLRGAFHLVLSGGTTPRALYAELARRGAGDARWHIWYGDERCLAADHPERNSVMAEQAWLAASRIPPANRRPMPAERGATLAASDYAGWLQAVGDFDLVLLGMGEDGHTASLFPDHARGVAPDSPDVLAVFDAPKPPPERVSLSAARLCRSRKLWFVVTGAGKRTALAQWQSGALLPASEVSGRQETIVWLDAAAARVP
ncbi:MAG: 6-phosphogluconolactonase [Thiobacillus sp. 65-29]|nr:MAG: 6-phosphogluconolactonase [Thiobacillus sp. 65-29]